MQVYPQNNWLTLDGVYDGISIFVDDSIMDICENKNRFNVAYTVEPVGIIGSTVQNYLLANYKKFDLILTDQTPLLALPNAELFPLCLPWIFNEDKSVSPQNFGVSTVVGRKKTTLGHRMRHGLWDRQDEIKVPRYFFTSYHGGPDSDLVLGQSKLPLFDYKFQIVIENSKSDYYITEKIMDCFRCFVVPIYYGARNIDQFFDGSGIFQVNSIDEIIDVCGRLTPDIYDKMHEHILNNYEIASKYLDFNNRITTFVNEYINK